MALLQADRHGERRDRALTEANVGAAACAVLAPLLLGLLLHTPAGWRPALGLPALILAGLYLRYRHQPLPAAPAGRPPKAGRGCRCPAATVEPVLIGACALLLVAGLRLGRHGQHP